MTEPADGNEQDPTSTSAGHLATLENLATFLRGSGALDESIEIRRRVVALRLERLASLAPSDAADGPPNDATDDAASGPPNDASVGAASGPANDASVGAASGPANDASVGAASDTAGGPANDQTGDAAAGAAVTALAHLVSELLAAERTDDAEAAIDDVEAVVREQPDGVHPTVATAGQEVVHTIGRLRRGLLSPLHRRAVTLAEHGDHDGALEANARAIAVCRRLAELDRRVYRVHLAAAIDQRSSLLSRGDRPEEALVASREAVELLADPTGGEVLYAARALHHLAARLGRLGAHREAADAAREALSLFEQVAATDPAAGGPMLLTARHDLANRLGGLGDHDDAIAVARTGVDDARRLAATDRAAHLPSLVACLDHLSTLLAAAGSARGARKVRREHDRLRPEARRIVRDRGTVDLPS